MSRAAMVHVQAEHLTLAYGERVVLQDVSFAIQRGEIFTVIGSSGCGKSTLLRSMIGLLQPASGRVCYDGRDYFAVEEDERRAIRQRWGVLFQSSALFSAMTLAENVALPLQMHTRLTASAIRDLVEYKLSLVGLSGFGDYYPAALSGGMQKRAALARALSLDPDILFFDEPSSGLDPLSARRLDELILRIRDTIGSTIVMVTHELASIFAIADRCLYLDADTRSALEVGSPSFLRDHSQHEVVRTFLNQGVPLPSQSPVISTVNAPGGTV